MCFFRVGIAVPSWYNTTSERASTLGEACKVEGGACSCAAAAVAAVLARFLFLRFCSASPAKSSGSGESSSSVGASPISSLRLSSCSRRPCLNHQDRLKHRPLSQSTPDKKWLETCARAQTTQQTTSKAMQITYTYRYRRAHRRRMLARLVAPSRATVVMESGVGF